MGAFERMLVSFQEILAANPATQEFGRYFETYAKKTTTWAYCHRLHSGLNTNMHIERMHRTIKYLYLKGKHNKRLDKAIEAIFRFVRDKVIDQLITIEKGKITSKVQALRKRHAASFDLNIDTVIESDGGWVLQSSSSFELYRVEETKQNSCCNIFCAACNCCIHRYVCTCLDSAIKYNMCKHIHVICQFRKRTEPADLQQTGNIICVMIIFLNRNFKIRSLFKIIYKFPFFLDQQIID